MAEKVREAVRKRGRGPASQARFRTPHKKLAGTLLAVAGMVVFMGIITAEAFMPAAADYSASASDISHLAGTDPPDSVIVQPSAAIFNAAMISGGLMIMAAAYFVQRAFGRLGVTIPLTVWGIGVLGVGIFPAPTGGVHDIFALLTFFVGGLVAVLAYKVEAPPLRYISVVLGAIPISILVSMTVLGGSGGLTALLGPGGAERWVAYPIVLWLVAFGGYLMAGPDQPRRKRRPG
ncbi:DUF998 domain-containing protein [Rubrobacter tropicus]|uniref:DUF998 domain-containing protein n=1 Tax=Rubrobacter tropicus TaxID=2653851 RepID=A0A6G8QE83_9ACTN|nr:DUF998 domain-containing protein [Rubrobacter tropicus]QIN84711.1 DUF998 domain-containing protein [Rubrobacter tropicus]